ncbi:MAG: acyltransferase [Flavobacteriales bacterium]|nr:acyltransferase [Flavobacteriales bacterium]
MRPHLPGLNALRAIAAVVVVTVHVEMEKKDRGIPSALDAPERWIPDHHLGVVLFFVLSGFLITWLLTREHEATGRVGLKSFYARRILRIWPVYYFVLFVSAALFPFKATWPTVVLCVGGMPNIAKALDIGWPTSPQIWSIGVEEQFYLLWPVVFLFIPRKRLVLATLLFFVGWTLLPFLVDKCHAGQPLDEGARRAWSIFFYGAKFNSLALGCVMGYLFATAHRSLRWLSNTPVAVGSALLAFGLWFSGTILPVLHDEVFTVLFALVVLNAATGRYPTFFDRGVFDFLGRISYGIYMYHWIILLLIMPLVDRGIDRSRYDLLLGTAVLGVTILVAWSSHIGPERYFLGMKRRYAEA